MFNTILPELPALEVPDVKIVSPEPRPPLDVEIAIGPEFPNKLAPLRISTGPPRGCDEDADDRRRPVTAGAVDSPATARIFPP